MYTKKKKQPSPSLAQCYKMNQEACCVSAHDGTIEAEYQTLLSAACLREYEHLEQYFCLGCAPDMYKYVQWYDADTKANCAQGGASCKFNRFDKGTSTDYADQQKHGKYGMLRLCNKFLDNLFFMNKNCAVTGGTCAIDRFDNCGLFVDVNSDGNPVGVLPSAYFTNASNPDYIKFIQMIRPPYFSSSDFDISVEYLSSSNSQPGDQYFYEAWDTDATCFSSASRVGLALGVFVLSVIMMVFTAV